MAQQSGTTVGSGGGRCAPATAQGLCGAALLACPRAILASLSPEAQDERTRALARLLGLRQLLQAALLRRRCTRAGLLGAAAVDATHCASMVLLAVLEPRGRRAALASALLAGGLCAFELLCARRSPGEPFVRRSGWVSRGAAWRR